MSFNDPIGYSSSDFFYVSALANNNSQDVDKNFCKNVMDIEPNMIDASCNILVDNVNKIDLNFCTKAGICQNQYLANKWTNLQTNHSGSGRKLEDVQMKWYVTGANAFNLIVGIGLITLSCSKSIFKIMTDKE